MTEGFGRHAPIRDVTYESASRRAVRHGTSTMSHRLNHVEGRVPMIAFIKNLVKDTKGQDLAEYGIALAVIAIGAATAAVAIAGTVEGLWTTAQAAITAAV